MEHFTSKARIWEHVKALNFQTAISIGCAFSYSTFANFSQKVSDFIGTRVTGDGGITIQVPVFTGTDRIHGFDPSDTGAGSADSSIYILESKAILVMLSLVGY